MMHGQKNIKLWSGVDIMLHSDRRIDGQFPHVSVIFTSPKAFKIFSFVKYITNIYSGQAVTRSWIIFLINNSFNHRLNFHIRCVFAQCYFSCVEHPKTRRNLSIKNPKVVSCFAFSSAVRGQYIYIYVYIYIGQAVIRSRIIFLINNSFNHRLNFHIRCVFAQC